MRFSTVLVAGLLGGVATAGLACEMPPLVAIPAKDKVGDRADEIRAETAKYFDAMRTYTQCVQAELAAAGGDNAPEPAKKALIQRNNAAVAEAEAVMKLFTANVGPVEAAGPPVGPGAGPPPPADEKEPRQRNRR